jgi:hypothetical protein
MKRILLIGLLLSTHALGFNVTVQDNIGTSTNGSFIGDVWTPTADSILDSADLNTQLSGADTTIDTNGAGTISIDPVFNYAGASDRILVLTATSDITIQGAIATSNQLAITATSSGGDLSVRSNGIRTLGGNINLSSVTGTITITDGGIASAGGDIELSANLGIASDATGIASDGGKVTLRSPNGGISAGDNGIQAGTGFVEIIALNDVSLSGSAIVSGGASIEGENLTVQDGGIVTNGGDAIARLTADVTVNNGGIYSEGGNIEITSAQTIFVNPGRTIDSDGGNITLIAETAIIVADGAPITSDPGAGGVLTVDPGVTIGTVPPSVGAGDISLLIRLFGPAIAPQQVPTLSIWGLGIMSLLLAVVARRKLRSV